MTILEDALLDRLNANKVHFLGQIHKHSLYKIDEKDRVFVKIKDSPESAKIFLAEAECLKQIGLTGTVKVPKPLKVLVDYDDKGKNAIVLEYHDVESLELREAYLLGRKIGLLHNYNRLNIKHEKKANSWVGRSIPSERDLIKKKVEEDDCDDDTDEYIPLQKHLVKSTPGSEALVLPEESSGNLPNEEGDCISKFIPNQLLSPIHEFGFHEETYCNSLHQINEWTEDWISFYARYRLETSINMVLQEYADRNLNELWSHLQLKIDKFFDKNETIVPSLLHGNMCWYKIGKTNNVPIVYNPSSFYGHNEYEFGVMMDDKINISSFKDGYFEVMPKKKGFSDRIRLYSLFHQLNLWYLSGSDHRQLTLKIIETLIK